LAGRAQVGYGAARYTASRLLARGDLVQLQGGRPAVLAVAPCGAVVTPAGGELGNALQALQRAFWRGQQAGGGDEDAAALVAGGFGAL
jgi:hypothetical protein